MNNPLLQIIIDQWSMVPAVEVADLSGKTVIVVGANIGLGFEAAKHFARMGPAKLIISCRSESKGTTALAEIQTSTGFQRCELWVVDLSDFASVTRFVHRFDRECERLDLLVMNAAVATSVYEETVDGWETSLQVNHLATSLMSLLLIPCMVHTGKKFGTTPRLVIVSSELIRFAVVPDEIKQSPTPIAKLNSKDYREPGPMRQRYIHTKLLNVFFTRALQSRLHTNTPLTVTAVNPGYCLSHLRRNVTDWPTWLLYQCMDVLLAWTAEQGSRQLVYAAVAERNEEERMKGAFVSHAQVVAMPSAFKFVLGEEGKKMQDAVWRETVEILTKEVPELELIIAEYLT